MIIPKKIMRCITEGNVLPFYNWSGWRNLSKEILRKSNNECQKCKGNGKQSRATVVHHIKHVREYPLLALEKDNLIALCDTCHNEEHPEKLKRNKKENNFMNEEWF